MSPARLPIPPLRHKREKPQEGGREKLYKSEDFLKGKETYFQALSFFKHEKSGLWGRNVKELSRWNRNRPIVILLYIGFRTLVSVKWLLSTVIYDNDLVSL